MAVTGAFSVLLAALLVDAVIGDPRPFYRVVPHPAVLLGWGVGVLDRALNRGGAGARRVLGGLAVLALVGGAGIMGALIVFALSELAYGWVIEAVLVSTLLSQNSLYRHVADVAGPLEGGDLGSAREAVGRIVGRDTKTLDQPGVARGAIESLGENYSDGVVAPLFWAVLLGLPGIFAYKALNTADSMIGHRTQRHAAFGFATARLDDLVNYLPARLAGGFLALAATTRGRGLQSLVAMARDGRRHRSVNAGYPEAALAGALGLRLAGPRIYEGAETPDAWMGDGTPDASATDIRRALSVYVIGCVLAAIAALAAAAAFDGLL